MTKRITSLSHSLVKHFFKLKNQKAYRQLHKTLVLEGSKTIKEVCSKIPAHTLLVSDLKYLEQGVKYQELILVAEEVINKISTMKNPEGILAVVDIPCPPQDLLLNKILILDGISDPGNAGTLIRSALAFGWDAIIFLKNCVDPFNDKTVRAAKSSLYSIPIYQLIHDQLEEVVNKFEIPLWAADLQGQPFSEIPNLKKMGLILGNEAHGPSPELVKLSKKLTIPFNSIAESLNVAVAGSILLQYFSCKEHFK